MRAQKQKRRIMIAVVVALILALIVFGYVNNLSKSLQDKESKLKANESLLSNLKSKSDDLSKAITGPKGYALCAKNNIYAGTKLTSDMMEVKEIALEDNANNVFQDAESVRGKVVLTNIEAGDPVLKNNLDLNTFDIPSGMRVITIPADLVQGLASYIDVGAKIDIVSSSTNNTSQVILQNIQVLSLGKNTATNNTAKTGVINTITLEIPASASAKLVSALSQGKIQLLMRNIADKSIIKDDSSKIHTAKQLNTPKNTKNGFVLPPAPSQIKKIIGKGLKGLNKLPELPGPAQPPMATSPMSSGPSVEVIKASEKQPDVQFDNNNL